MLGFFSIARLLASRLMMPSTDTASYGAMLKDDYHSDAILNSLNDDNIIQNWMTDVPAESTEGLQHIWPIKTGRNYSVGSIGAEGALPQDGRIKVKQWKIGMRDVYLRVGWNKYVLQQSRNKKGGWGEAMAVEMESAVEDCARVRNRIGWGTGLGILAKVSGSHAGVTTIEVKDSGGVASTVMPNRFIQGDSEDGMLVMFRDGASPATIKGYGKVTGCNADGTDFTIDTPQTLADGDLIVNAQQPGQDSYDDEPEGILSGDDDGTYKAIYHNLARATVEVAKSLVVTGIGPLSLDAVQQLFDGQARRRGGKKKANTLGSGDGVARAYMGLLEADRRYTGADLMSPDGGTKRAKKPMGQGSITYGGVPWLVDFDAPFSMLFGLRKESWLRLHWPDSGWDETGGIMKWVQEFDKWTSFWHLFENYHCAEPMCQFRGEGITTNELAIRTL